MIAYKFLRTGRVGPFSGETWPAPRKGAMEADGELDRCRNGVHACRVSDLPYWLDDELWEVELDEVDASQRLKLVARRGRLVRPVDAWNGEARRAFAEWCVLRVAKHAADELANAGLDGTSLAGAADPDEVAAAAKQALELASAPEAANARRLTQYAEDAIGWANEYPPSGVAYVAAHAADARSRSESANPFAAERELQAEWLAARLGLEAASS